MAAPRNVPQDGLLTLLQNPLHLDFSNQTLNIDDVKKLADVLPQLPELISISFSNTSLTDEGAIILVNAMKQCPYLVRFNFEYNKLNLSGISAIIELIVEQPCIAASYLNGNSVSLRTARALMVLINQRLDSNTETKPSEITESSITLTEESLTEEEYARMYYEMVRDYKKRKKNSIEKNEILKTPQLNDYYTELKILINATVTACFSIYSGMIKNSQESNYQKADRIMKMIMPLIPFGSMFSPFLTELIEFLDSRGKNEFVDKIVHFAMRCESCDPFWIESLARDLTKRQETFLLHHHENPKSDASDYTPQALITVKKSSAQQHAELRFKILLECIDQEGSCIKTFTKIKTISKFILQQDKPFNIPPKNISVAPPQPPRPSKYVIQHVLFHRQNSIEASVKPPISLPRVIV